MRSKRTFGGDWTEDKLNRLRKYLPAYTTIFKGNLGARFFKTVYVDAFAGTGYRVQTNQPTKLDGPEIDFDVENSAEILPGSAKIALSVEPSFDKYLFIENDAKRFAELSRLPKEHPDKASSIEVINQDANQYLRAWCAETDWSHWRAVVFLDPFGMQVDWSLLEAIARTRAIDLWLLFPIGMGVNRMLTSNEPPPEAWALRLTRVLGSDDWREAFYPTSVELTLFGPEETQRKIADFSTISEYFVNRLKLIFAGVAPNPRLLTNSINVPLYMLCFASANPKGATTAVKIAQDILGS